MDDLFPADTGLDALQPDAAVTADQGEDQPLTASAGSDAPLLTIEDRLSGVLAGIWAELSSRASEAAFLELLAQVLGWIARRRQTWRGSWRRPISWA